MPRFLKYKHGYTEQYTAHNFMSKHSIIRWYIHFYCRLSQELHSIIP